MNNQVSIILSTYNEKDHIEFTIKEIIKYLPDAEIVVVDDNSPDGTFEILKKINYKNLKIFNRKKTKGLASAFLLGLINSSGNIVGWVDTNMGKVVTKFPSMLEKLDHFDIVLLSRYIEGGSDERRWIRRTSSLILNKFAKLFLNSKITDLSSGIFLMKRSVLENAVPIASGHGEFMMEFIYNLEKKGNKISEIPYSQPKEDVENSKSFPNLPKFLIYGSFYIIRIIQTIIRRL